MSEKFKSRLFYGWVVVVACFFICAAANGVRYSFGVFFKSIESEFSLSRAETSLVFSVYMALCPIFALLGGWLIDRYGPKRVGIIMGILMTISLLATSQTTAMWQLFITYSLLLAIGTGANYSMVMATASRWFSRKRGLVLGIVGSGVGTGTIIMNPLSAYLITAYNWRIAFLVVGLIAGLVFISFILLLKRDPGELGLLPDGVKPGIQSGASPSHQTVQTTGFSLLQAAKTRSFWLLGTVWLFWSFCLHLVLTHLVPHITDVGISATRAALIAGLIGAICIPGRLGGGWLTDKINKKVTSLMCIMFQAVAMLWLIWANELWGFYLFVVFFSLGYGGLDPPMLAQLGEVFGLRSLTAIMGALIIPWGIGAALGPAVGGLIFDATGSYSLAFLIGAVLMLLAGLCAALIGKEKGKEIQKPVSAPVAQHQTSP